VIQAWHKISLDGKAQSQEAVIYERGCVFGSIERLIWSREEKMLLSNFIRTLKVYFLPLGVIPPPRRHSSFFQSWLSSAVGPAFVRDSSIDIGTAASVFVFRDGLVALYTVGQLVNGLLLETQSQGPRSEESISKSNACLTHLSMQRQGWYL
jgi:hypothetical protein